MNQKTYAAFKELLAKDEQVVMQRKPNAFRCVLNRVILTAIVYGAMIGLGFYLIENKTVVMLLTLLISICTVMVFLITLHSIKSTTYIITNQNCYLYFGALRDMLVLALGDIVIKNEASVRKRKANTYGTICIDSKKRRAYKRTTLNARFVPDRIMMRPVKLYYLDDGAAVCDALKAVKNAASIKNSAELSE